MRIGIDATCWSNKRGYGRYLRELLPAMLARAPDDEFLCFIDPGTAEGWDVVADNVTPVVVRQSRAPTEAASANGNRAPVDMLRMSRAVWRGAPDVFFSPSVYTYFPLPPRLRAVVTIHDTIAERYPHLTLPTRKARWFWNAKVALAIRQARLVLTISEYSSRDIARVLGVKPERIRVAEEAPAPIYRPTEDPDEIRKAAREAGLPPDARWFIYVGGFNPHKRVDDLVRAHARAVESSPAGAPHLVLVGARQGDPFHGGMAEILEAIGECGTEDRIHWAGFVPDDTLRHLHSGALGLVLPSECEGFGLPAVEAAACGCPVLATRESPLPELLDGGGFFFAPGDLDALTDAMSRLATEPGLRDGLGRAARARAEALSWDRTAEGALAALQEAAA